MPRREQTPFAERNRRPVALILALFVLFSLAGVMLSILATSRSKNLAVIVRVEARQRMLIDRYVNQVMLVRAGRQADPGGTGELLARSVHVLLEGGKVPAVDGDDDEATISAVTGQSVRAQLEQERRLVSDLTATGSAVLAGRPVAQIRLTAHERLRVADPVERVRVLAALASNASLNTVLDIAGRADRNVKRLIVLQAALGAAGLLAVFTLAWALIAITKRQAARLHNLVTSSTDFVLIFDTGGCRYASRSVASVLGRPDSEMLGDGFMGVVHSDDRAGVRVASTTGEPRELVFRVLTEGGELRHLEAHASDLRGDRQIRGVVLRARDVSERVRLEEELTRQAFHDGLTGLANRALLRDRLDQALVRSQRSREPFAVLMIDLDGFKKVNDSLGHDAGDQLLRQVGERFAEVTRPTDTLARQGGDEFVLLLAGADEPRAVAIAARLLAHLSEPVRLGARETILSASIGIVVHPGGVGESDDLLRNADLAMYTAKDAGRNRYELYRHDMGRALGELLGLEEELRAGLARGEFSIHYQTEVDLETRAIVGIEALLRWDSPTRGSVPPLEFIPAAEETGLIISLGEFVLHEACAQTARWDADGLLPDDFVTWVNLSAKQLNAGGIVLSVERALEAAALPPYRLGLEVTETAVVAEGPSGERARDELHELHERGVRIAIDDFGTGFSSIANLRRFPVDVIKVDRSFIQGADSDAKDAAITSTIAGLAHALGLRAVAEGVESSEQLGSALKFGCDVAQGFLFARPVPAAEMRDVLVEHGSADAAAGLRASA